ncbi:hypothetical protein DERP_011091 [Dermatophagoides pteronyssinus]|uniref:Transmembrane protein n=1 Tax=Dermatophagoides pteronyssinus TaxID=6956 RepID=A0ABQ8J8S6_DERPT|nr:hypothetical protein DERP_011091 [Dermatophagoides pteronyssinus]
MNQQNQRRQSEDGDDDNSISSFVSIHRHCNRHFFQHQKQQQQQRLQFKSNQMTIIMMALFTISLLLAMLTINVNGQDLPDQLNQSKQN